MLKAIRFFRIATSLPLVVIFALASLRHRLVIGDELMP